MNRLAIVSAIALVAAGCGTDGATEAGGPLVVRGQSLYAASDGGGPYTFVEMYLELVTGQGAWDDKTVDGDGYLALGVHERGAVARYARSHGGTVRFELLANFSYFHGTCGYVVLPAMRLGKAGGETAWLDLRTGKPLPPIKITPDLPETDCDL